MAKNKNLNPADAFRKAQRKKELKKNKTERSKARDFALVKKDTGELEEEIGKLEGTSAQQSASDKARLAELKTELEKITKKKQDYVAEHPEHRKLVFRSRKTQNDHEEKEDEIPIQKTRKLFDKHGLPRHPERSIYYDPVMNSYGVPPPGMPYVERPLRPDEVASDEEDGSGEDEDIVMPEGPPPGASEDQDDSDDDIPMPEGPPPPKAGVAPLPPTLPPHIVPPTAFPAGTSPPPPPGFSVGFPPPPASLPSIPHPPLPGALPPLPPGFPVLPSGLPLFQLPPPPSGFPNGPPVGISSIPPPPPGFPTLLPPPPGFAQNQFHPPPPGFPPPPLGFFPRRSQSASAKQDPLSSIPHQTYQAHRASRLATPAHPSLPPNPSLPSASSSIAAAATVSAAPELRNLKKESTAFVPTALKRKKAGAVSAAAPKINAAPSLGPTAGSDEVEVAPAARRPDLLSTLQDQFGSAAAQKSQASGKGGREKPKDDYEKFVEEMDDILGPPGS
ncbi:hypothetical protein SCP_0105130 [Sparassis crispa]|uniref:Wbp11/ELF5/Saf1 N-terminal domain-containing protein n=1 Tax=Sparassis crispa TaxID=139825 RepID=A0A401G642_9APHY|nr:hypothetical protein SCP_0105130 [Sparassis crispa]GBE77633.1 hypothetical protein SCP_0105130 [Sparassis crispa]